MDEMTLLGLSIGAAVLFDVPLGYNYTRRNINRMRSEGKNSQDIKNYLDNDAQYFGFPDKFGYKLARKIHGV